MASVTSTAARPFAGAIDLSAAAQIVREQHGVSRELALTMALGGLSSRRDAIAVARKHKLITADKAEARKHRLII